MSVEYTILRCLIGKPSHGYELQRVLATLSSFYPLTNVNVYPALKELEESGYVSSSTEVVDSRARRTYSITEKGNQAFEQWMASPPELSLAEVRDPVHLRLALAIHDEHEFTWLSEAIDAVVAKIEWTSARYERSRCQLPPVVRIAAEELIANLERRRSFLERALALVEREEGEASKEALDS